MALVALHIPARLHNFMETDTFRFVFFILSEQYIYISVFIFAFSHLSVSALWKVTP